MQHALASLGSETPTKRTRAPPLVPPPARPLLSPAAMAEPSISAAGPARPALNATPSRPRAASSPPSSDSSTSLTGKNTLQCGSMTKAGKQCLRQVRLPSTHSYLDPVPVLYCHQHREAMITAQTGFYVRRKGLADRFVEFSDYVPVYLQIDTQLALRAEMEKATSSADVPGYIYTYEIRDPAKPKVIQLKVGRAVNLNKRLDQWDRQCGSKVQIVRGWWPGTVDDESEDGANGSLLKGHIKAGEAGPLCHRVERLVHIELADLSLHAPYMEPSWPKVNKRDVSPSGKSSASLSPKKLVLSACSDCGAVHREIFAFPRPEKGRYKGREWELIVKPVIDKWGKFIREYYS
ncbi:hypothetical protein F5I97DRAFT_1800626 [Phlebopus sp. FC_14]|nr:hypothetical protein F5I97DRAFT_1800626 [Phlebopus sp. FC_14]